MYINAMLEYKNFVGVKEMIDGLVTAGIATQADYDNFAMILAEQNINLTNYENVV